MSAGRGAVVARRGAHLVVLLRHVLGATVWTGGHLVLAVTILPGVPRSGDLAFLQPARTLRRWRGTSFR